jgi:hypothetical protein
VFIHTQKLVHILAGFLDRTEHDGQHQNHETRPNRHRRIPMYTISTTPDGRVQTAETIPDAMAVLASQLTKNLSNGPVAWKITDPDGTEHRGNGTLNGRLDLLTIAVDELVERALHPAAPGRGGRTTAGACNGTAVVGTSGVVLRALAVFRLMYTDCPVVRVRLWGCRLGWVSVRGIRGAGVGGVRLP